MKKYFLTFILLIFTAGCANLQTEVSKTEIKDSVQTQIALEQTNTNSQIPEVKKETKPEYPGVTIDQKFPILADHYFQDENFKGKPFSIKAEDFELKFNNLAPKTIDKNGKSLFTFKTLTPNDYHSTLAGTSRLLGKNSKEIYVVTLGPGAVCCTNYWITDVSSKTPRNIFRSEDYGGLRDPMEIFDSDGDGIYELMQWDSSFRYFLDDCGACSPEPRAIFKYNKSTGKYLPAKNIQQDFVRKSFLETEKWILESFEKLEKSERTKETENQEYMSLKLDYNRRFLDHVVDIFYLGDENKAWKTFDKYYNGYNEKEKVRAEIKNRLRRSKFYQALKKSS